MGVKSKLERSLLLKEMSKHGVVVVSLFVTLLLISESIGVVNGEIWIGGETWGMNGLIESGNIWFFEKLYENGGESGDNWGVLAWEGEPKEDSSGERKVSCKRGRSEVGSISINSSIWLSSYWWSMN